MHVTMGKPAAVHRAGRLRHTGSNGSRLGCELIQVYEQGLHVQGLAPAVLPSKQDEASMFAQAGWFHRAASSAPGTPRNSHFNRTRSANSGCGLPLSLMGCLIMHALPLCHVRLPRVNRLVILISPSLTSAGACCADR